MAIAVKIHNQSSFSLQHTSTPEKYKYVIHVVIDDTTEEIYYSRGEITAAAALSSIFGPYSYSSYHSNGYLRRIQDTDNVWAKINLVSLWKVYLKGVSTEIAVYKNDLYQGRNA